MELCILNPEGKEGRKYRYPPSLILFISLLKEDDGRSYRRAISKLSNTLARMGLPEPHYSTLHKSQSRFEMDGFGARVMSEATVILLQMGVEEALDPIRTIHTSIHPGYVGPKIPVECQKDADRQKEMDEEAKRMSEAMHVSVMRSAKSATEPLSCAVDGSGESLTGPGLYFEHIWRINNRRFIKQHTMLDLDSLRVVSYAITMESPGDAKMFVPLVSGALLVGVKVGWVAADSAYDSRANWEYMDAEGIAFCPNLKEQFKDDWDLKRREALASFDERFGKELAHRITGYTKRWLVESFFSVFKKLYGEGVRNRKFKMMVITMDYRYQLYDIHRDFIIQAREGVSVK